MALNIFEQYGIKEVANVYFQALAADTKSNVSEGDIVLYLDTLKVSTIEQTAEQVDARGGWGNPKLITWDYGKEISLTLTDALISMESLRLMMGGAVTEASSAKKINVYRTAEGTVGTAGTLPKFYDSVSGNTYVYGTAGLNEISVPNQSTMRILNMSTGKRFTITSTSDSDITSENLKVGDVIRAFWVEERDGSEGNEAVQIVISPSTFPGTYRLVGDTFIRSAQTGKDEAFQFVINKAKVASNVTISLEAEGDPSTFDMTITVLRDGDQMMSLNRY